MISCLSSIPTSADLLITNVMGEVVRRIHEPSRTSVHRFVWDGRDEAGALAAPGSYSLNVFASGEIVFGKIIVTR